MQEKSKLISIVIPAYNEEAGIKDFHTKMLAPALSGMKYQFEIIYVNDGSRDETLSKLAELAKKDKRLKIIDLSRNFGKEIALSAGIFESKGDAVMILDADGQHPPKLIPDFINEWQNGNQVVIGVRQKNHKEGLIKKAGSNLFYALFTSGNSQIVPRSTDFRLIDKEVRESFILFSEKSRIARGLIDWMGYKRSYINFNSPARYAGEASYRLSALVNLAINSFISLSLKPLFAFGWIGLGIMFASLFFGLFIIIEQIILGDPLALNFSGSVMLGTFTAFLVSLILISQAIIATYISHIHVHSQNRPLYIVNKKTSINI